MGFVSNFYENQESSLLTVLLGARYNKSSIIFFLMEIRPLHFDSQNIKMMFVCLKQRNKTYAPLRKEHVN